MTQGADGALYGVSYIGGANASGVFYKVTATPAMAAPVQLTAPSSVAAGAGFSLGYLVVNSYDGTLPGTMNLCLATNNAGDTTGWTGVLTGEPTEKTAILTAPSTPGTYTYALTCGGTESGFATITVSSPPAITFTSVTHNMGTVAVGSMTSGSSNYGVKMTNTSSTQSFAFDGITLGNAAFTQQNNCLATIAPAGYCQIEFTFAPKATGTVTATWSINTTSTGFTYSPSNGGTLTGTGSGGSAVTISTAGHDFGDVTAGQTSALYGTTITNGTASEVTLTLGSLTAPFDLVATNCGTTIPAGGNCGFQFDFAPTATGITQQLYSISINGGAIPLLTGSPATTVSGVTLTGTGQ